MQTTPPLPPGPKGKPVVGHLLERRRQPLRLFLDGAMTYGGVVHYKFGPKEVCLVTDLDGVKHVLQDNARNYVKGFGYDKLAAVLGNGLFNSEGEFWRRQRRLAQPAFHHQRLAHLAETMTGATQELLDRWEEPARAGQPVDLAAEMMRLTLTIVGRTLLGSDTQAQAAEVYDSLTYLLEQVNRRILSLTQLFEKAPLPRNLKFRQAKATLDRIIYRIIEERRRDPSDRGDLLSMLMAARDEETGRGMSDEQLRDELMTIFLAGHETTATALTWAWYLLSRHPEVDRRFREELRQQLGGRRPGFEDVAKLPYARMVFDETLRLYPPAWVISRQATADDVICGFHVPKDTVVILSPYVIQHLPRHWDNPEGFDPERFTAERQAQRPKFAYLPFGGGARQCIGSGFAVMEALLILAMIGQRFRPELLPGREVLPEPLLTLRPKGGMWVTLRPTGQ